LQDAQIKGLTRQAGWYDVPPSSSMHDCPAPGRRVQVALWASLRDRLRRTRTQRPLARDWHLPRKMEQTRTGHNPRRIMLLACSRVKHVSGSPVPSPG
jgi:hypothetical protein